MTLNEFFASWRDTKPYIEVQTSGSTGMPKHIKMSKRDMKISAESTNAFLGLGRGARFVCPMDFRFIGAKMMAVRAEVCGGEIVEVKPSNRFTFNGIADLLAVVPSQVDQLLECPEMAARVRNLIIGGAPLSAHRVAGLQKTGIRFFSTYGMTETASHVALASNGSEIYEALPGIEFSTDKRGCLVITMENRDCPEVVTNDIVSLINSTRFKWVGRYDNIINSGGIKIMPEQIEDRIAEILWENDIRYNGLCVIPQDSEKWGTEAVCLIEMPLGLPEEMIRNLRGQIDPWKCPREFIRVEVLPRTPGGKIDRQAATRLIQKR